MSTSSVMKLHPKDFYLYVNNDVGELGGRLNKEIIRLADHRVLGSVAIRCFSLPEDVEERGILVRKIEEGLEIYQKASNDFLVRIYGYVKWSNSMGIVMEHMPAGRLAAFTTGTSTQLTPKVILRMASDISRGIACMHNLLPNKVITHGNLKPKHILLSGDLRCKVAGFGVDELLALVNPIMKRSKKVASAVIDLAYAAPEILKDLNIDITKEQDTYSFGMLLYALITHNNSVKPLFMGNPVLKLREQGDRPTTTPIDKLKQNLDDEDVKVIEVLVEVMQSCWHQNPTNRPEMDEVRSKLQVLLHKQNQYHLLKEAAETIKELNVCLPMSSEQEKCLLSAFCTENNNIVKDSSSKPMESKPDVETQKRKKSPEVSKQSGEQSKQKISKPVAEVMESKIITVGSDGGEIDIAGCKLIIPEKALRESIELSLTAYYQREPKAEVKRLTPILKCEPHDLTFDKEVEIHLPTCFFTDGVTSVSAVFRQSRDGSHWEELKTMEQKTERFFRLHLQQFSWYDVILEKIGDFSGVFIEKRVECGFLLPGSNYSGALQAKCSVADSIDVQRKEMEGFTNGYADRVLFKPGETYADFELKCDGIAANSEVKRLDNLRVSSYQEISFTFPSRGEIWDNKKICLTMTSEKEIWANVYVPKAAATGNVSINVQTAYGSNIGGGSITETDADATTRGLSEDTFDAKSVAISEETSSVIGPNGGVIEGRGYRLTIPRGALDTEVTIKLNPTYGGNETMEGLVTTLLRCEPSGQKFKKMVIVRLYTCYVSDKPAIVQVRKSEDKKIWATIKQLDHADERFFEFSIKGFSWFAAFFQDINLWWKSEKRKLLTSWIPKNIVAKDEKILRCFVDDDVPDENRKPNDFEQEWKLLFFVKKTEECVVLSLSVEQGNQLRDVKIWPSSCHLEIFRVSQCETSFLLHWLNRDRNTNFCAMIISVQTIERSRDQRLHINPPQGHQQIENQRQGPKYVTNVYGSPASVGDESSINAAIAPPQESHQESEAENQPASLPAIIR